MQAYEDPATALRNAQKPRIDSVPATTTPLFGREADLDALGRLLAEEQVRLLSLTGSGGTGKTRLACAAAVPFAAAANQPVYFVDLSPLEDPGVVPASVAQAIGIQDSGSEPLQLVL